MEGNKKIMSKFKKLVLCLCAICFCSNAISGTINWTVDGETYATTNCESGDDVILPTPPTKPGQVFLGWGKYQQIEYIEFNGAYIDTGIIPTPSTKFRVKLNMSQTTGGVIIGFVANNGYGYRFFNYGQNIYFDQGTSSSRISGSSFYNYTTYDFLAGCFYVKDYETDTILIGQQQTCTNTFTESIRIGNPTNLIYGKIYLLQIWNGDTLVRDLVPAIDPYGEVCMYDLVSEQFFYNQGSGDLIAGPLVQQ